MQREPWNENSALSVHLFDERISRIPAVLCSIDFVVNNARRIKVCTFRADKHIHVHIYIYILTVNQRRHFSFPRDSVNESHSCETFEVKHR